MGRPKFIINVALNKPPNSLAVTLGDCIKPR
nr:MAG TPA: hypothetical protein [Caudoviricetes sp.]